MANDTEFELLQCIGDIGRQIRQVNKWIALFFGGIKGLGFVTRVARIGPASDRRLVVFVAKIRAFGERSARFSPVAFFAIGFLVRFDGQRIEVIVHFGSDQFLVAGCIHGISATGFPASLAHFGNAPIALHRTLEPQFRIVPIDSRQEMAPIEARETCARLSKLFKDATQPANMLARYRSDLFCPCLIAETIGRGIGLD